MIHFYNKHEDKALFWKCSKYPASFFRLLGCLVNYYGGTYHPKGDTVQSFRAYQANEAEVKAKAINVHQTCMQLLSDIQGNNDVNLSMVHQEDTMEFKVNSQNVCDYLAGIHFNTVDELFLGMIKPIIGTYPTTLLQRFEFVVGAYIYHGLRSGEWVFYNNFEKMKLVHEFMVVLADEEDEITTTSLFKTPHVHKIKLNLDGPLWKTIEEELKASGALRG